MDGRDDAGFDVAKVPPPPSKERRFGPMFAVAAVLGLGLSDLPLAGQVIGCALAFLVGWVLWPPTRHKHREAYRGTVWTVKMGLFLIFVTMLGQMIGGFLVGMVSAMRHGRGSMAGGLTPGLVVAATTSTVATAAMAVWILRLRGGAWWALGLQWRDVPSSFWLGAQTALALAALRLVFFKLLQALDTWQLAGSGVVQAFFGVEDAGQAVIGLVLGAVLVPIAEEILFRGVLFAALRRHAGPVSAVIVSSSVFGLCHAPDVVFPGLLGVVFALLYHRTGTLWAPISAHMVVNGATLALAVNHGQLTRSLAWTQIAAVVMVAGALQLMSVPGDEVSTTTCMCKAGESAGDRCPDCCFPIAPWPRLVTTVLAIGSTLVLTAISGLGYSVHRFLYQPYEKGAWDSLAPLKHEMLRHTDPAAAARFLSAWAKADPRSKELSDVRAALAYEREDYATVVGLIGSRRTNFDQPPLGAQENNMLALALAELGADPERAISLARSAVAATFGQTRASCEETLGWALVRNGQLADAVRYLDRPLGVYGMVSRKGAAEINYHRGVLLWAIGDQQRARSVLQSAADMGVEGNPFSKRAAVILEKNQLPPGLVRR